MSVVKLHRAAGAAGHTQLNESVGSSDGCIVARKADPQTPRKAATVCTHKHAHRSERQPSSSPPAMMRPVGLLRRGRNTVSAASAPVSAAPAATQLAQCSC